MISCIIQCPTDDANNLRIYQHLVTEGPATGTSWKLLPGAGMWEESGGQLQIHTRFGIGSTQVLAHPHLLMMLPQQLLADRVAVFGNDPDQAVDIFRMVPNQFGEFLHLRLEMFETPAKAFLIFFSGRLFLGRCDDFFRQGRHQHILFHIHPFSPPLE